MIMTSISIYAVFMVYIVMRSVAAGVNLRVVRLINVLQQIVGPFILSTLVDLTTAAVYSGAASQASPFIGLLGSK